MSKESKTKKEQRILELRKQILDLKLSNTSNFLEIRKLQIELDKLYEN
jgi:hypothetical protein